MLDFVSKSRLTFTRKCIY